MKYRKERKEIETFSLEEEPQLSFNRDDFKIKRLELIGVSGSKIDDIKSKIESINALLGKLEQTVSNEKIDSSSKESRIEDLISDYLPTAQRMLDKLVWSKHLNLKGKKVSKLECEFISV